MAPVTRRDRAERRFGQRRGILALWIGVLGGPLLALASLHLSYAAVPPACNADRALPLHLVPAVALLLAVGGFLLAWRDWRETGREWPGEEGGTVGRSRFLAAIGVLLSAFFAVVIVAMWAPTLVIGSCQGT
jgi:hypothetical protein